MVSADIVGGAKMQQESKINAAAIFSELRAHPNKATGRTQFRIRGVDLSLVNGLRRTILTDIPTVGLVFEGEPTVVVKSNTGPLHNEILVHRMSMLPIHLTEEEVETYESRSIRFEIQKHNATTTKQNLTTHDMEILKDNVKLTLGDVKRLFPANPWSKEPILITRLRPGESIQMNGEFVKSTARVNAGFSPVSLCSFTPEMDTERVRQEGIINVLDKERAFLKNDYGDPIAWLFELEPENGLSVDYLVSKAFEILIGKVIQARRTLMNDDLEVLTHDVPGTFEYVFKDEDDTLGNLIQAFIHNTYYRTERLIEHRFRVSFVGYFCPHPLETKMHVRLTLRPPTEERTDITEDSITELAVRDFFKHALDELGAHLTDVHREWCHFTGRPMPEEAPESPPMEQPEPTTENVAEIIPFGKVKSDAGPSAPPAKEPAAKEPAAPLAKEKEPAAKEPAAKEPAAPLAKEKEPAAKEPAAKEPAAKEQEPPAKEKPKKKPVAKKKAVVEEATKVVEIEPSAKEPSAKEPSAKEPSAKEPSAKEPPAKEPAGQVAAAKEKKKAAPKKKKVVEKEEE